MNYGKREKDPEEINDALERINKLFSNSKKEDKSPVTELNSYYQVDKEEYPIEISNTLERINKSKTENKFLPPIMEMDIDVVKQAGIKKKQDYKSSEITKLFKDLTFAKEEKKIRYDH